MKSFVKIGIIVLLLSACATRKPQPQTQSQTQAPIHDQPEPPSTFDQQMDARVEATAQPDEKSEKVIEPLPPPRAPVIGVWIDGAGLESFLALGFMQELERAGVKFAKVVGTGWGCWVATSWAVEASANQAEWQAFKWSSWAPLGLERGFLSRITGDRSSYDEFEKELRVWLPKKEFAELAMPADCPVLNASSGDLLSGHGMGMHRALWEQLQTPLFKKRMPDNVAAPQLSGLIAGELRLEEYDRFAQAAGKSSVEFWIHLKPSPASLLGGSDKWLAATFARRELKNESWAKTEQGRWVMRMPLFLGQNLNEKKSLDFGGRRALLLKGREQARTWMQSSWFRNNLAPAFASPPQ